MTAPADWLDLNKDRPPLPRRITTPLFEEFADRFDSATAELPVQPVWPAREPTETGVRPVAPPRGDEPTVEFRAVKPRRWSRLWWRENLSFSRIFAGGASAVVLVGTAVGWFL